MKTIGKDFSLLVANREGFWGRGFKMKTIGQNLLVGTRTRTLDSRHSRLVSNSEAQLFKHRCSIGGL